MDDSRDNVNNSLREEVQQKLRQAKDLLRRVKDTDYCIGMKPNLIKIEAIFDDDTKRLKTATLLEVKKILEKGVQKTTSKLVLESYNNNTPSWEPVDLLSLPARSNPPQQYSSTGTEERLAFKYPRRKISSAGHSSTPSDSGRSTTSNNSGEIAIRSTSPLFRRRHEVFPSQPTPATYAEHKRLSHSQQCQLPLPVIESTIVSNNHKPSEIGKPSDNKIPRTISNFIAHVPVQTSQEINKAKQLGKNNESSNHKDVWQSSSANKPTKSYADSVYAAKKNNVCSNHQDLKESTLAESRTTSYANSVYAEERNDEHPKQISIKEPTSSVSTTTCFTKKVNTDQTQIARNGSLKNDGADRNSLEITTKSTSPEHKQSNSTDILEACVDESRTKVKATCSAVDKSSVSKPSKPKSKGHSRELHDLLSYTTEIMPKIANRRKSVSREVEEINAELRAQFNIKKNLLVILQRVDPGVVAHRTRSKSIDTSKFLEKRKEVKQIATEKNTTDLQKKISQKQKKSPDQKKSTAESSSSSSSRLLRQTARKSSSKSETSVSKKRTVEKKDVIKTVTIENDQKSNKPKSLTKKRERHSRSPSPLRPKRLRSSAKKSSNAWGEDFLNKSSEETEDEESSIILSAVVLRDKPKPNNDPRVHCHSDYMEDCCLCSYKGENMVQHYVYNHPKKAVYISRVAPEQADLIKADPLGINGEKIKRLSFRFGRQEVIKFRCYFCDLHICESQELWMDHISGHTGEYRYKCVLCPTVARSSIERVQHHAVCSNPSIQLWQKYSFENNHLYGYMCLDCNFVQVLYENMARHLREDHANDSTKQSNIIRFSLVNFALQDNETDLDCGIVKLEPILDDTKQSIGELKRETDLIFTDDYPAQSTGQIEDCVEEKICFRPPNAIVKQEVLTDLQQPKKSLHTDADNGVDRNVVVNCNGIREVKSSSISKIRIKRLPGDMLSIPKENYLKNASPCYTSPRNQSSSSQAGYRDDSPPNTFITTSSIDVGPRLTNGYTGNKIIPLPRTAPISITGPRGPPRLLNGNNASIRLTLPQPMAALIASTSVRLPILRNISIADKQHSILFSQSKAMADIKPWNGKRNAGKLSVHKLTVPYLIAEFKCTVYDCGFYTDTPETIKAHFETHQKPATQPAITRFSPWLECWFCKHVAPNTSDLLEHVQIAHKHCGYQCDRCCYRSRDPNSVVVHQRKYHVEQFDKAKILCVPGRQKPYTDIDDDAIMNEMKTNVKCLQCSHCSMRKFIDLDEFLTHIDGHNKTYIECHVCTELLPVQTMSEHIKLHNIYLFQCVYCDHGTIATARIMEHVTDEHPERMLFYHTRVSRNNYPPFVRGLQRIAPSRYVVCPAQSMDVVYIN